MAQVGLADNRAQASNGAAEQLERWLNKRSQASSRAGIMGSVHMSVTDDDEENGRLVREDEIAETEMTNDEVPPRMRLESSRTALADVALRHALPLTVSRSIRRGLPGAVVITVPSAQWVAPIAASVRRISHDGVALYARDSKVRDGRQNDDVSVYLADGRSVVGISQSPDTFLPPTLNLVAAHRVSIPLPTPSIIKATMKLCQTGRVPGAVNALSLAGLDYDDICALLPKGEPAKDAVRCLAMASSQRAKATASEENLPKLEEAIEYGEARTWALNLKQDIADLRAGRITARDVDKGVILHGPPGTGKTLLARMLGRACGIPTVLTSVGEWFATTPGHLDEVIRAQRAAFQQAVSVAPSILFLDEMNAMPSLENLSRRNKDYWTPVILDFYLLLDSAMSKRDGVIVIGATNRIEDIGAPLLRPGRLERAIYVGPPNAAGLEHILRHHLETELSNEDLMPLAEAGVFDGATGAVAMEWVRSARRLARRANRPLSIDDLRAQVIGPDLRNEVDRGRAAVHEAAHCVVGLGFGERLQRVSIRISGRAGGFTKFVPRHVLAVDRLDVDRHVTTLLAAHAAEVEVFGTAAYGAGGSEGSDLALATASLAAARASYGMAGSLLWRCRPEGASQLLDRDPAFRDLVEQDLQKLYAEAVKIVRNSMPSILAIANALEARQSLEPREVDAILQANRQGVRSRVENRAPHAMA